MNDKRVTIKEIAAMAGVSIGAVHSALYDKPGVSQETKQRIMKIAKDNNYHLNRVAASLKKKTMYVAVVIPALSSVNRYYFNNLWVAMNDYKNTFLDYNISFIEIPYYTKEAQLENELTRLSNNVELSALIAFTGYMDSAEKKIIQDIAQKGVTVVLVGEDNERLGRMCSILPDYEMTGQMVGELISRQLHDEGNLYICAGDVTIFSHYQVVDGICRYFEEHGLKNQIIRKNYSRNPEDYYDSLVDVFSEGKDISAAFAVTARESVIMGKALEATGRAGKIIAVGSDVFEENIDFLQRGVFTNLLNKNPYTQMLSALKSTVDYLVRDIKPTREKIYVGTEIVFKSSLSMYQQSETNRLLL